MRVLRLVSQFPYTIENMNGLRGRNIKKWIMYTQKLFSQCKNNNNKTGYKCQKNAFTFKKLTWMWLTLVSPNVWAVIGSLTSFSNELD